MGSPPRSARCWCRCSPQPATDPARHRAQLCMAMHPRERDGDEADRCRGTALHDAGPPGDGANVPEVLVQPARLRRQAVHGGLVQAGPGPAALGVGILGHHVARRKDDPGEAVLDVVGRPVVPTGPMDFASSPVFAQPLTGALVFAQPLTGALIFAQPLTGALVFAQPLTGALVFAQPLTGAPVFAQPLTGAPVF